MKKTLFTFIISFVLFSNTKAQTVNFSEDIAAIIYNHCTPCHRPGEVAPFSLTNYTEVQSWASMIKYVTGIKYMPPWKPEQGVQTLRNENFLSSVEIQKIADWVDGGTPQGDPSLEPALPIFPSGSQIGTPDLILSFAQSYNHVGNNLDEYRYFVLPTGIARDTDLVALEVRPGNKRILHHTLIWADTTGTAAADDAATPEYGYESGSISASQLDAQLPGYVPGQKPLEYTLGIAQKLYAGTDLKLQMHYAPVSADETDSTTVNLFFAKQPATRYVNSHIMVPLPGVLINGPFIIPANQVKEFHGIWNVTQDISMLGIGPHCHLLGQSWNVYAITPTNDTINLIKIGDWDFNWQGTFAFKQLIKLPQGSAIHAFAKYDNTTNNVLNPNNPPKLVSWGENTSDEMYYLPLLFLPYQAGDENIIFDQTSSIPSQFYLVKDKLYPISPNPSSSEIKIGYTLSANSKISLRIFDMSGKLVKSVFENQSHLSGLHSKEISLSDLVAGRYEVILESNGNRQNQPLLIIR